MASIRRHRSKWQVQVRRQGSPPVSRTFQQRDDAQRWARQTEARIDRQGLSPDPRQLAKLTLGDLLRRFKDTECPKRRGGLNEAIVIAAILGRDVAKVPLSALSRDEFAKYRDLRLKTIKPGTLLRELGLVQAILERARNDWGIPLRENPLKGLRKPKADKGRDRRLSPSEWDSLTEAFKKSRNSDLQPLVELALETGMRRGELLNARVRDVDQSNCTLHIADNWLHRLYRGSTGPSQSSRYWTYSQRRRVCRAVYFVT
jgi:integrase